MANLIEYIQSQVYENSTEDISGSIMQQVLTRMASDEGVVNVHTISGQTPFADYNNAQAARDAVPAGFKKLGLIITYKLSSGWYIDEFIGSATSGWSTASNWKCLGPVSVSQNTETGHMDVSVGSTITPVLATQEINQLKKESAIYHYPYNVASLSKQNGFISISTGVFNSSESYKYSLIDVTLLKRRHLTIANNDEFAIGIAFLTSNSLTAGSQAPFCESTSIISLSAKTAANYTIPRDCNYVYFVSYYQTRNVLVEISVDSGFADMLFRSTRDCLIEGVYTNNSVQITKLMFPQSGFSDNVKVFNVNQTFNFVFTTTNPYKQKLLVLHNNESVALVDLDNIVETDTILLIYEPTIDDYIGGALYNDYVSHKKFTITTEIDFTLGALTLSTGKVYLASTASQMATVKKMMDSDKLIVVNDADSITINDLLEGETARIYCYDKNLSYLGYSYDLTIATGTKYIRIEIVNTNTYTHPNKSVSVTFKYHSEKLELVNCGKELVSDGIIIFNYPVEYNSLENDNTDANIYKGNNSSTILNCGYIILPVDYENQKESPVVVHCHGTAGVYWRQDSNKFYITQNQSYLNFIAKNGYAVIGCSTTTELYSEDYRDADISNPLTYAAYSSLYNYVMKHFALDDNNVAVFGYSAGGNIAHTLGALQPFKIKCVASLAGCVDYVSCGRVLGATEQWGNVNVLGNMLNNIPTENQPNFFSSAGQHGVVDSFMITRFKDYRKNIAGVSPIFFGIDGDIEDFMQQMYSTYDATTNYDANATLVALVDNSKIYRNIPTKIWQAQDDAQVAYALSKFYQTMIQNGGGLCYIRTMPNDTGGHFSVGVSDHITENVLFMDYITKYGETINIPVAWGEMVDWFNRW